MNNNTHHHQEESLDYSLDTIEMSAFETEDIDLEELLLESEEPQEETNAEPQMYQHTCKFCKKIFFSAKPKGDRCSNYPCDRGMYMRVCDICGDEFLSQRPFSKRCSSRECHNEYQRRYRAERISKMTEEERQMELEKRRQYNRKDMRYRRTREKYLEVEIETARRIVAQDKKFAEWGVDYGKLQARQILASIPKIDVNL